MFLFLSVLITMLLIDKPNINKANAIFITLIYFSTQGIINIYNKKPYLIIPILTILIINFGLFTNYYFNKYNKELNNQQYFATCYLDAIKYSKNLNKSNVFVEANLASEQHIYILLENKISPYKYNNRIIETKNTTYNINENLEINSNSAYILKKNNRTKKLLESLKFNKKKFCDITIYYNWLTI